MTRDEIELAFELTRRRIAFIERKAYKRLLMTEEENAWFKLSKTREFKDFFLTLLILGAPKNKDAKG